MALSSEWQQGERDRGTSAAAASFAGMQEGKWGSGSNTTSECCISSSTEETAPLPRGLAKRKPPCQQLLQALCIATN
ncbi:hypothetical protein cyc_08781 [Cyclospora cayetanensis]|uniref:Uncharacterized protein n=1 Tax=Cyclospora cayetanensis TaxID=88456 RepID=A0A1D3D1J6_9EIME|nr:hypothetical protein cyc_08781 [Cyclospora cayetanensis]